MDYREQSSSFEHLAAFSIWQERYVVTGDIEPEVLVGAATSLNLFRTLGVEPLLGRGFVLGDENPTLGNPVVLSHELWQRRFGRDSKILGRTVSLEGNTYEVVGVMPEGFAFPSWAELWRPMRMSEPASSGSSRSTFLPSSEAIMTCGRLGCTRSLVPTSEPARAPPSQAAPPAPWHRRQSS